MAAIRASKKAALGASKSMALRAMHFPRRWYISGNVSRFRSETMDFRGLDLCNQSMLNGADSGFDMFKNINNAARSIWSWDFETPNCNLQPDLIILHPLSSFRILYLYLRQFFISPVASSGPWDIWPLDVRMHQPWRDRLDISQIPRSRRDTSFWNQSR